MPGNVPPGPGVYLPPPRTTPDEDDESETVSASATSSSPVELLVTQTPPSIPSSEPPTTGTPSLTSIPVETSPAETAEPEDGAGLAESARIGIGVGVGVGVSSAILLIVIGVFLYLRRRRKQQRPDGEAPAKPSYENPLPPLPPQHATGGPSELDSSAARPWSMRSELPDTPRSVAAEMESPGRSAWREKTDGVSNARVSGPMGDRRMHTGPVAELPG